MELKDRTAIITGATGKLGRVIASSLAKSGCNCICHYNTNQKAAVELQEEIQKTGQKALTFAADLTDPTQIEELFDSCKNLNTPTILINSAAVFHKTPLKDITLENSRKMLDINLLSPVFVSSTFSKILKAYPTSANPPIAKIVNLADIGGIRPWANYTMYCASKAALIAATKSMAKELAPEITVNAVAPGVVSWPEDGDNEEYERQVSMIPAGRTGTFEEIANAVIFLLKNDYITGQVINVDGGRCI